MDPAQNRVGGVNTAEVSVIDILLEDKKITEADKEKAQLAFVTNGTPMVKWLLEHKIVTDDKYVG